MAVNIGEILAKHGLTLETVNSEEGMLTLATAYGELLDSLGIESDTQAQRERKVRDSLLSAKEYDEALTVITSAIRSLLNETVNDNGSILPRLVVEVDAIKRDLMTLRDYEVQTIARSNKPVKVKEPAAVKKRKEEAEKMREAIDAIHLLMGRPEMKVTDGEGENEVVLFSTKKVKDGFVPDLQRIPSGPKSGNVGRGAKIRQMLFAVDGEFVSPGTLWYDVVKVHLCDFAAGQVTTPQAIAKQIEESGASFAPVGFENAWAVKVFNHTVSGWLPEEESNEEVSEDAK